MCDAQVENQGNRPRSVSQVGGKLNVSIPLTPAPGHLLCLYFVGCAKMVSELLIRPWAFLTPEWAVHVPMITQGIKRKPFAATCRGRQRGNGGNLRTHSKGDEGLSETGRPSLILASSLRLGPERTEPRHLLVPKYAGAFSS